MSQSRLVRLVGVFLAASALMALTAGAVWAAPGGSGAKGDGPGCVAGGKGYVGAIPGSADSNGIPVYVNWHGSFINSRCPGATGPQDGDWDNQHITYPDGTTENYKIVYSTKDLRPNGVFCYWDLTVDPELSGTGYHPTDYSPGHLYWYIISSSGDSPYLEPAQSGGWQSHPNGFGPYK